MTFPGLLGASHINNNGTVAFLGQLNRSEQSEDPDLCRGLSVVQKTGNTYTTVVKLRDPVPSTETAQFATIQLGELFDSGAMLIYSSLRDDNASGMNTERLVCPFNTARLVHPPTPIRILLQNIAELRRRPVVGDHFGKSGWLASSDRDQLSELVSLRIRHLVHARNVLVAGLVASIVAPRGNCELRLLWLLLLLFVALLRFRLWRWCL